MLGQILGYLELARQGSASAWVQVFLLFGVTVYFVLTALKLWQIDLREHRLPDRLVLPMYPVIGLALGLVLLLDSDMAGLRRLASCTVFLAGCYMLLRVFSRGALGLGDVKLAGVIGMVSGYFSAVNMLWASVIAFLAGGLFSLVLLLLRRVCPGTHIAFGPFMLAGALISFFFPL